MIFYVEKACIAARVLPSVYCRACIAERVFADSPGQYLNYSVIWYMSGTIPKLFSYLVHVQSNI